MNASFMVETGFLGIGILKSVLSLVLSLLGIYAITLGIKALKIYIKNNENK